MDGQRRVILAGMASGAIWALALALALVCGGRAAG